ncbi:MAG: hypothetical protein P4L99_02705 [Chthoniobacter sp.]|nr:hypothetical protein [Chthoniobacter sp.]
MILHARHVTWGTPENRQFRSKFLQVLDHLPEHRFTQVLRPEKALAFPFLFIRDSAYFGFRDLLVSRFESDLGIRNITGNTIASAA